MGLILRKKTNFFMKFLICGLLCLFLIGSFSGVSHGKSNESKKTELVKIASIGIVYAIESNEVVINCPVLVTSNFNYEITETLSGVLTYATLKKTKIYRGNSWVGPNCNYKNLNLNLANNKPTKKRFNLKLYHKPKLC